MQVWSNVGVEGGQLRIVRFWAGNPNPIEQDSEAAVVIVASIQTLNARLGAHDALWLKKADLIVIDECHHAIAPSYSRFLRWLDSLAQQQREASKIPLIGLSATPFRTNDEESARVASRFGNRWLPPNQHELHQQLLEMGTLARAVYERFDTRAIVPTELVPDIDENLDEFEVARRLAQINEFLADDSDRNEQLVKLVCSAKEKSILFFANSEKHAREMSLRLQLSGIAAATVDGDTPRSSRRFFIEMFEQRGVRVLCNHSVLTTGFDAPKVDMILISRQVFSPVRYMQMVGRGLRGVANGGTAECRIVTVMDNLGRFAEKHAYHYCSQYFTQ